MSEEVIDASSPLKKIVLNPKINSQQSEALDNGDTLPTKFDNFISINPYFVLGPNYAILLCLMGVIGYHLESVLSQNYTDDGFSTGITAIKRCVMIFGLMRLCWVLYCFWKMSELLYPLKFKCCSRSTDGCADLPTLGDSKLYLTLGGWFILFLMMSAQAGRSHLMYQFLEKLQNHADISSDTTLMDSCYLIYYMCFFRLCISISNYSVTVRLGRKKYQEENHFRDECIPHLKRALYADIIIFTGLPAVMALYFSLTINGSMQKIPIEWQFWSKMPLFFVFCCSLFSSRKFYSYVYPSLEILNSFFLLSFGIQVCLLYGCYDFPTNTLKFIPLWVHILLWLLVGLMALVLLSATFCKEIRYRLFPNLQQLSTTLEHVEEDGSTHPIRKDTDISFSSSSDLP